MKTMLLIFAALMGLVNTSQASHRPKPKIQAPIGSVTSNLAPDSTLKLGTRVVISGWAGGSDTVFYQYYKNDTLVLGKRSVAFKDSTTVPAPAYDVPAVYKGCVQVERGGRLSGLKYPVQKLCWTFPFVRKAPLGTVDSIFQLTSITLRPLGSVVADSGGTCATWQAANPNLSVWIQINRVAVPACMHGDSVTKMLKPSVWQYCAFWEGIEHDTLKVKGVAANTKSSYCDAEFESWSNEKAL